MCRLSRRSEVESRGILATCQPVGAWRRCTRCMGVSRGGADEEDYDRFFDACLPGLIDLGRRLTGSRSDAEDLAVEALGRAYAHWPRIRSLPWRQAWVFRVAVNLAIGDARKRREPTAADDEPVDFADAVVLRQALAEALARLPRRQREAVALRYLADMSETDAAAAMGVSAGSVKTHLSRGLSGLRGLLGPDRDLGGVHGV